jgi:hypothetical protein
MRGCLRRVVVSAGLALLALTAQSAEFSVGRVEVAFAEDGWKELLLPDSTDAYAGEKDGALPVKSKLFVRGATGGEGQVFVLVSATSGGMHGAFMTYSPTCQSDESHFREGNTGVRRPFAQCLLVTPRYSSETVFKALAPAIQVLQSAGVVSMLRPVYTLWNYHAISTGESVDVRVFVESPLTVPGTFVAQALPPGVLPEHVSWGRQLIEAVKSSVHSVSGRLVMPAIRLAPAAPATPAPATSTAV